MTISFDHLYYFNLFTATIHLISGVSIWVMASLLDPVSPSISASSRNSTGPYLPAVCFDPPPGSPQMSNATDMNHTNMNHTTMNLTTMNETIAFVRGSRPRFYIEPEPFAEARDYIATIVVMFFLLSAIFQYTQCIFKTAYKQRIEVNGVNELRYVEYCLSASLMMILIACVVGVFDVFTHILLFTCTFLCMILGLVADFVRVLTATMKEVNENEPTTASAESIINARIFPSQAVGETQKLVESRPSLNLAITHGGWIMWGLHFMGWVAILVPYFAVFMVAYFTTASKSWDCLQKQAGDLPDVPPFVTWIIFVQFLLFASFGGVQFVQFYMAGIPNYNKESVGTGTELAFIILSLGAKSILGWVAASQIIFV